MIKAIKFLPKKLQSSLQPKHNWFKNQVKLRFLENDSEMCFSSILALEPRSKLKKQFGHSAPVYPKKQKGRQNTEALYFSDLI